MASCFPYFGVVHAESENEELLSFFYFIGFTWLKQQPQLRLSMLASTRGMLTMCGHRSISTCAAGKAPCHILVGQCCHPHLHTHMHQIIHLNHAGLAPDHWMYLQVQNLMKQCCLVRRVGNLGYCFQLALFRGSVALHQLPLPSNHVIPPCPKVQHHRALLCQLELRMMSCQ